MDKRKRLPLLVWLRRVTMRVLSGIGLIYLLLVVTPYIVLRLLNPDLAYLDDPKCYAIFESTPLYIMAVLSYVMAYIFGLIFLPLNAILITTGWRGIDITERQWTLIAWFFSLMMLVVLTSPSGYQIGYWLMD